VRELRSASVTVRLNKVECTRLRQRATEAGLTVSAYLRSCALEVDALRTQVKDTLAEFKTAALTQKPAAPAKVPRSQWGRLFRWFGRIRTPKE
jgi:hypothetical protein